MPITPQQIALLRPGDKIRFKFMRYGREKKYKIVTRTITRVRPDEEPDALHAAIGETIQAFKHNDPRLSLTRQMQKELARRQQMTLL